MLYILYGHTFWSKGKLNELVGRAREKGTELFYLKPYSGEPLNSFLSGDLFGKRVCLIGEFLFENPDYESEIRDLLDSLVSSPNIIFLREGELLEEWIESFKKAGAKMEQFKNPSSGRLILWTQKESEKFGLNFSKDELGTLVSECREDPLSILNKLERMSLEKIKLEASPILEPNYFDFADAASDKDKRRALLLLSSYMKNGLGAEEAFWRLWWKVKTLRIVDASAPGAALHPFVVKKASLNLRNFTSEELKNLSLSLADVFSEVRRGEKNFEEGLEEALLKL